MQKPAFLFGNTSDEYNEDRKTDPERWCNSCSSENQEKIKDWLRAIHIEGE